MNRAAALLALVLCGCAGTGMVVTGESLNATGETFIATADAMHAALENKAITVEQYRQFAEFGRRFQATYQLAFELWKSAREVQDAVLEGRVTTILAQLAIELGVYTDLVLHVLHPDGGT